jgi:dienelactone hydrolase
MEYYVSLPAGHTARRKWPVLVVIADASREFLDNLNAFVKAGEKDPFILVAPFVLTGGGAGFRGSPPYHYADAVWKEVDRVGEFGFDSAGLAAVAADVERLYGGERRYVLTGWEAGGHTVWAMVFRHPEALRAALPVSSNFRGRWLEGGFSSAAERAGLPVQVLFCGTVPAEQKGAWGFLMDQSRQAMRLAEEHGYRNVTLEVVPKATHGPLAGDVLAAVRRLVE